MISDTRMWYGSSVLRHGRSRPWARYQARSARRNRWRSGGGGSFCGDIRTYNSTRVKVYTKTADSAQAEKDYLARTGSGAWERTKPFPHAGADTFANSAQLLHDFAAAMLILAPGPDDLILDLGAGGCWCSDLLRQLHRQSVAVDISLDMLRVGRARPAGAGIRAVAGDLQALPFRSGTFQKAICLSALHHVPDMRAAMGEVARVLTDDGVALFSEPGRGHAQAAHSEAAMRDFGVLEQDVL